MADPFVISRPNENGRSVVTDRSTGEILGYVVRDPYPTTRGGSEIVRWSVQKATRQAASREVHNTALRSEAAAWLWEHCGGTVVDAKRAARRSRRRWPIKRALAAGLRALHRKMCGDPPSCGQKMPCAETQVDSWETELFLRAAFEEVDRG